MIIAILLYVALIVFLIITQWKIYEKAGRPGWEAIIPIYNLYVLIVHIVKRPWWWLLLMLIPIVGVVIAIILAVDLAKKFGKGGGFAVGLILLGIIFYPILAFGDAVYEGDAEASSMGDVLDSGDAAS